MASQIIGAVSGQSLTLEQELIVTGTNKYLTAEFKFSPDWDGLSIWAHFDRDNEHWKINLHDGKILREDKFAPLTGYWEVCLHGTAPDGMRITTQPVDLRVRRTNVDPDLPLGEIPSDVAERLDSRVTALEAGGGGGGTGGVSKEYVDRQDDEMLMDAMEYTDNQIKLIPTPDVDKAYVDKQDKATATAVDSKLTGYLKTGDISAWAKAPEKPAYTASEVGALSDSTEIPKALSELTDDSEHRTVSDAEKQKWNAGGSGTTDYNALSNKPTINNIELKGNLTTQQLGIKDGKDGKDGAIGPAGAPGKDGKDATFGYQEVSGSAQELQANTLYVFTAPVTDLSITLAAAEGVACYDFFFTASGTGCNLSLPEAVHWDGDKAPALDKNKTYEVNILRNIAKISEGATL